MAEEVIHTNGSYAEEHTLFGRRRFLKYIIGGVAALEVGYLAGTGIDFLASSEEMESKPVELSVANLPIGERVKILYNNRPAEVLRTDKDIVAKSLVCTHLGCIVMWEKEHNQYHCPCHDARFDAEGKVISGPPSMPLEKLKVTVKGSSVIIGSV